MTRRPRVALIFGCTRYLLIVWLCGGHLTVESKWWLLLVWRLHQKEHLTARKTSPLSSRPINSPLSSRPINSPLSSRPINSPLSSRPINSSLSSRPINSPLFSRPIASTVGSFLGIYSYKRELSAISIIQYWFIWPCV